MDPHIKNMVAIFVDVTDGSEIDVEILETSANQGIERLECDPGYLVSAISFGNKGGSDNRIRMIEIGCSNARPWNDDEYSFDTKEATVEGGESYSSDLELGDWKDFVEMDEGYLACGAQVKY